MSGCVYVVVRAGWALPLRLAAVDTVHVYVGIASIVVLAGKVRRVGVRAKPPGFGAMTGFDRLVSMALVPLYGGVYATGIAALLPWETAVRDSVAEAHLIVAVWAAVPTTWHIWRHRSRLLAVTRSRGRIPSLRLLGLTLTCGASVAFGVTLPRSVSPAAQTGAGGGWHAAGPVAFTDRLRRAADGTLVAGGDGLWVRHGTGGSWRRVGPFGKANAVLGLTLPVEGRVAVYVGTTAALYSAASVDGPYHRLPLRSSEIHAIAVDPADPEHLWVSSKDGFWESQTGGRTWTHENAGVRAPTTAWALAWFDGTVYGSDVGEVYRRDHACWTVATRQADVDRLDAVTSERLYASSMGDGIRYLEDGRWHAADGGLVVHSGGGVTGVHAVSVSQVGERLYAGSMEDGVQVSADGGRSWSPIWWRLASRGDVWRVLGSGTQIVAATDSGIVASDLIPSQHPEASWWWIVFFGAGACGAAMVLLSLRSHRAPPAVTARRRRH